MISVASLHVLYLVLHIVVDDQKANDFIEWDLELHSRWTKCKKGIHLCRQILFDLLCKRISISALLCYVNFSAKTYWDLCEFNKCDMEYITEPPITFGISDDDLKKCAQGTDLVLPDIPINSINNERAVQETSKACRSYSTYEKRHANIIMTMNSRAKLPYDPTKKDFA